MRLLVFAYFTAIGLLLFGYRALDDVARERHAKLLPLFIEQMTGAYAVLVLLPLLVRFARRYRLQRGNWRDAIILLVLGLAVDLRWFDAAWPAGLAATNSIRSRCFRPSWMRSATTRPRIVMATGC